MKIKNKILFIIILIFQSFSSLSQSSCASPINLGIISSTVCVTQSNGTTSNSGCSGSGYGGGSSWGVTYFEFCTNSSADCINFNISDITTSGNWTAFIYDATSCTYTGNGDCLGSTGSGSSFNTSSFSLSPNTCYVVRLASDNPGTFTLCAEVLSPSNDSCAGATPIDFNPQSENNFCKTPGPTTNTPTIVPSDLCAGSLENTAWYTFTTQNTGDVVINIENIVCSGGASGFQIGYFVGSCGTLTNIGCQSGSGGNVTATITGLVAGDEVYIAIDGNAGANCTYDISATNTIVLPIELIYFEGKRENNFNVLEWVTASESNNDYFVLEKSINGYDFYYLSMIKGAGNSNGIIKYNFLDPEINIDLSYYRLTQFDYDGKSESFPIIAIISNIEKPKVVKVLNYLGQEVDDFYKGVCVEIYSDGTFKKTIRY